MIGSLILQESVSRGFDWGRLLQPDVAVFVVAALAVVVWGGVAIIGRVLRHQERLEMIRNGINPDAPAGQEEEERDAGGD